jgi:hypothetical protein
VTFIEGGAVPVTEIAESAGRSVAGIEADTNRSSRPVLAGQGEGWGAVTSTRPAVVVALSLPSVVGRPATWIQKRSRWVSSKVRRIGRAPLLLRLRQVEVLAMLRAAQGAAPRVTVGE